MEKIKIEQKKKLKLRNVLVKTLKNITVEEFDEEVKKFINFLEVSKLETKGPLITNLLGSSITSEGELTFDYNIMIQTVREVKSKKFSFHENIVVDNCLYVKFQGLQEEFNFVQSKLDLYIWENDLIETGQEYTIHISSDGYSLHSDIFRPVEYFHETIQ